MYKVVVFDITFSKWSCILYFHFKRQKMQHVFSTKYLVHQRSVKLIVGTLIYSFTVTEMVLSLAKALAPLPSEYSCRLVASCRNSQVDRVTGTRISMHLLVMQRQFKLN